MDIDLGLFSFCRQLKLCLRQKVSSTRRESTYSLSQLQLTECAKFRRFFTRVYLFYILNQ